jgi:tetratricopeptide (TPR) repeat protein
MNRLKAITPRLYYVREEGNKILESAILTRLGVALFYKNEFDRALEKYEEALNLFDSQADLSDDDMFEICTIRTNMGNVYWRTGELDSAVVYYANAILPYLDGGNSEDGWPLLPTDTRVGVGRFFRDEKDLKSSSAQLTHFIYNGPLYGIDDGEIDEDIFNIALDMQYEFASCGLRQNISAEAVCSVATAYINLHNPILQMGDMHFSELYAQRGVELLENLENKDMPFREKIRLAHGYNKLALHATASVASEVRFGGINDINWKNDNNLSPKERADLKNSTYDEIIKAFEAARKYYEKSLGMQSGRTTSLLESTYLKMASAVGESEDTLKYYVQALKVYMELRPGQPVPQYYEQAIEDVYKRIHKFGNYKKWLDSQLESRR